MPSLRLMEIIWFDYSTQTMTQSLPKRIRGLVNHLFRKNHPRRKPYLGSLDSRKGLRFGVGL